MTQARKSFSVCQVNFRSVCATSRLLDLEILTITHSIDVLCLTETWLTKTKLSSCISLPGYQLPFRRDRCGAPGGGVAIYVRTGIAAKVISLPTNINIEVLCLQIMISCKIKLNVIVAYRPPGSGADAFFNQLDEVIDTVQGNKQTALCIVGDFNAKVADWFSSHPTDTAGRQLKVLASSHALTQVVSDATYGVESLSPSRLDLVFINKAKLFKNCTVLPPVADHCPTLVQLQMSGHPSAKTVTFYSWDVDNADFQALRDSLSTADWSTVIGCNNVSEAVSIWSSEILSKAQKFVPLKRHCIRQSSKPWYTPHLHKIARLRNRLFRQSRGLPSSSPLAQAYKKTRNWYLSELRRAEHTFFKSIRYHLHRKPLGGTSHSWWSRLKSAAGWTTHEQIPPLQVDGNLFVSAKDRAEALNSVFAKQCSAPATTLSPSSLSPSTSFTFQAFPEDSIANELLCLNVRKATGLDGISSRLLRECAHQIARPLTHIFNLSLLTGVFPSQWKVARIQPVFKQKGDRCDASNYRPIALLCVVSKVFERLVRRQLQSFCVEHTVIPDQQFGFLPGRSTVWQLLSILDEWHDALENGNSIHALFLDMSKAFDRVDHRLLLSKLASVGVSGSSLAWLESYLTGRYICTSIEHVMSPSLAVTSGVPQGSVLGPLLFLVYVSDLPASVSSPTTSCAMFADDSLIYETSCCRLPPSRGCELQTAANNAQLWADKWVLLSMPPSPHKCSFVVLRELTKSLLFFLFHLMVSLFLVSLPPDI